MKNNKVYIPKDAITRHENFEVWYADGETFLSFKGDWSCEHDRAFIFGRMGGEMGQIKPDAKNLTYYLKLERWEYVFHTLHIFKHYYINGMKWYVDGSLSNPPFDFALEEGQEKDGHVRVVDFLDRGECYEVKVRDVAKLRIAVAAVVAMGIKEEYKGLSEGEKDPAASRLTRIKNWCFAGNGIPYEKLVEKDELV